MKHLLLSTTAALLFAASGAHAAPEQYTLDPYHTNITWKANHVGFSNPSGKFAEASGQFTLDEAKPENSSVTVTIKPGSVLTGIPKFDEHLKSADFFNTETYTEARFESTKVVKTGEKTAKVHGNLTLLGITKPVVLNVTLNKIGENPFSKQKTAGFSATAIIKRSEFGMNYGIPVVSDDVQIEIEVEGMIKG